MIPAQLFLSLLLAGIPPASIEITATPEGAAPITAHVDLPLAVGDRASVRCRLESERDSYLLHLDAVLRKDVSARHRYSSAQEMEGSGDA